MVKKIYFNPKKFHIKLLLSLTCFLSLFFGVFTKNDSFGRELTPQITNIEINNSEQEFFVSFSAKNIIYPELQEILKSGIPLKYIYEINIIEEGLIRDSSLFAENIVYQINYDNLKDEIRIINSNSNVRVFNLKKFSEAESIIFDNQTIKINKKNLAIIKGGVYSIKIRTLIERLDSNLQFGFLPFFHSNTITSKWNEVKFLY
jgi:hypothetical protein